jgi:hypothetical protein
MRTWPAARVAPVANDARRRAFRENGERSGGTIADKRYRADGMRKSETTSNENGIAAGRGRRTIASATDTSALFQA